MIRSSKGSLCISAEMESVSWANERARTERESFTDIIMLLSCSSYKPAQKQEDVAVVWCVGVRWWVHNRSSRSFGS